MRRKILTIVMLLAFVPTLLIGFAMNYCTQTTIQNARQEMLTSITYMIDFHMNQYYDSLIAEIKKKAETDLLEKLLKTTEDNNYLDNDDRKEVQKLLLEEIDFPVIEGALIDAEGKIVVSSEPSEEGLKLDKTELYRAVMEGKEAYKGLVMIAESSESIEIAVPIFNDEGQRIGIFKQILKLDPLKDYLDCINVGEKGFVFIIRNNGSMFFRDEKESVSTLYHEYQDRNTLEQLVFDFKQGQLKEKSGTVEFEKKGEAFIGAYKEVDELDCIVVAALERSELFSELVKTKEILFLIGIFAVISAACMGYILSNSVVKPLKEINGSIKKIADGDLTVRCSNGGDDEYKVLTDNINSIAESLQKSERELRMSARIDNLTHLANRYAIYEVLDTLLYKHPNQALLLVDLSGFKTINANLGHDIGDRIIMEVGDILRALPQHICYPSRLGGDEFLVFLTNWTADKYPERIAKKIIEEIEGIRFIDEIRVDFSVCIGIEYMDDERIDKKKLIKHSNIAMHKAKATGKNSYSVYNPFMLKE